VSIPSENLLPACSNLRIPDTRPLCWHLRIPRPQNFPQRLEIITRLLRAVAQVTCHQNIWQGGHSINTEMGTHLTQAGEDIRIHGRRRNDKSSCDGCAIQAHGRCHQHITRIENCAFIPQQYIVALNPYRLTQRAISEHFTRSPTAETEDFPSRITCITGERDMRLHLRVRRIEYDRLLWKPFEQCIVGNAEI